MRKAMFFPFVAWALSIVMYAEVDKERGIDGERNCVLLDLA